jgi:glycosyltransferase involved in cell wall biosynthesis
VAEAPAVRFLLVGLGTDPETLAPELAARGIQEYVVGAGYTRDVDSCYAAMDISVLTSSTEGLSITLLESMRHGLPTVVTRVGGNQELVVDGETGYLVPLDDAAAFVARVIALARDGALRRTLGTAGRRRVAEHFALERVADHYLTVYEGLLAEEMRR